MEKCTLWIRISVLAALAMGPATMWAGTKGLRSPAALPTVRGRALDGAKIQLPKDFTAPLNLIVLSFDRGQETEIQTWLPVVARMRTSAPKVQVWMLPVSERTDKLYQWWLNSSLRTSLPADQSQHYTLPLYVHKAAFLKQLGIRSQKRIVLLITGKSGIVLWRGDGAATARNQAALESFLADSPLAR